ncbi:Importin subunit alpha-1 [Pelomyxa schiedti]|nr:Importin subunit alpha-1 [Pelomyxa schiedti]
MSSSTGSTTGGGRESVIRLRGIGPDDCRRRREAQQTIMRKSLRDERVLKKRNIAIPPRRSASSSSSGCDGDTTTSVLSFGASLDDSANAATCATAAVSPTTTFMPTLEMPGGSLSSFDVNAIIAAANASKTDSTNVTTTQQQQLQQHRNSHSHTRNMDSVSLFDDSRKVSLTHQLSQIVSMLNSTDPNTQHDAASWIRVLISLEENAPPLAEVVNSGAVPKLVEFLERDDFPQLQLEAAWALTNIAAGTSEQTEYLIHLGIVPLFIKILQTASVELREQVAWGLGNIAGDSPTARNLIISSGGVQVLASQFTTLSTTFPLNAPPQLQYANKTILYRNTAWTLSNLSRGKPPPPFEPFKEILPILATLVYNTDSTVLEDICWTLAFITEGSNDKVQAVVESGVCSRVVELLMHPLPRVQAPALRIVGNVVAGSDVHTQVIINLAALPCLHALLGSSKPVIRKEACWALSNILAGPPNHVAAVINAGIVPTLIGLMQTGSPEIKVEATWCVSNAASAGDLQQVRYFVKQGCIPLLCDMLLLQDSSCICVALNALEKILKCGQVGENEFVQPIVDAGGAEQMEVLQGHGNNHIYELTIKILETYFGAESSPDSEDNNLKLLQAQNDSNNSTRGTQQQPPTFHFP